MSIGTSWVLKPFITKYFLLQADDAVQGDGNQQGFQFDPSASLPNEFRFWCVATATQHTTLSPQQHHKTRWIQMQTFMWHTHIDHTTPKPSLLFLNCAFCGPVLPFLSVAHTCVDNMNCVVVFKFPVKVKNHFVWI